MKGTFGAQPGEPSGGLESLWLISDLGNDYHVSQEGLRSIRVMGFRDIWPVHILPLLTQFWACQWER